MLTVAKTAGLLNQSKPLNHAITNTKQSQTNKEVGRVTKKGSKGTREISKKEDAITYLAVDAVPAGTPETSVTGSAHAVRVQSVTTTTNNTHGHQQSQSPSTTSHSQSPTITITINHIPLSHQQSQSPSITSHSHQQSQSSSITSHSQSPSITSHSQSPKISHNHHQ